MLTKPRYGWTNLRIGDICYPASYLNDVPIDCLDAFIYALKIIYMPNILMRRLGLLFSGIPL